MRSAASVVIGSRNLSQAVSSLHHLGNGTPVSQPAAICSRRRAPRQNCRARCRAPLNAAAAAATTEQDQAQAQAPAEGVEAIRISQIG